jgi:hypothetical protein
MASPDSAGKRLIKDDEDDFSYVHVRLETSIKDDLQKYANKENTSMTAVVTALVQDLLYKQDEDEELDEEDQLLDMIVTSLMNLERRMEIRLATLQDTFNSLIGRLIDAQQQIQYTSPSQMRKKRKGDTDDAENIPLDLTDVLEVDKEEEIYKRVKRFLQQQGRIVELQSVIQQLEMDRMIKEYLDDQDKQSPGIKEALVTDAIQEAAYELGYPMIDTI